MVSPGSARDGPGARLLLGGCCGDPPSCPLRFLSPFYFSSSSPRLPRCPSLISLFAFLFHLYLFHYFYFCSLSILPPFLFSLLFSLHCPVFSLICSFSLFPLSPLLFPLNPFPLFSFSFPFSLPLSLSPSLLLAFSFIFPFLPLYPFTFFKKFFFFTFFSLSLFSLSLFLLSPSLIALLLRAKGRITNAALALWFAGFFRDVFFCTVCSVSSFWIVISVKEKIFLLCSEHRSMVEL